MTTSVCSENGVVTQPNITLNSLKEMHHQQKRSNFMNTFTYRDFDRKINNGNIGMKADVSFTKSRTTKPMKSKRDLKDKRADILKEGNGAEDSVRLPAILGMESVTRTDQSLLELRNRRPKEAYLERLNTENTQLQLIREDGYVYHCQRNGKLAQSFPPITAKTNTQKTPSVMAPHPHHGYVCSVDVIRKKLMSHQQDRHPFALPRANTDYQLRAMTYKTKPNRRMVHYEREKHLKVDFRAEAMTPVSRFHDGRENSFVYQDRIVKTYTAVDGIIQNKISPRSILKKQEKPDLPLKKFKRRGKRKSSINFGENMIREIVPSRCSIDTSVSFDYLSDDRDNLGFPSLARSRISLPRGRARQGSEFQASQDFIRVMSQLENEACA
jgi:hypothetical protein